MYLLLVLYCVNCFFWIDDCLVISGSSLVGYLEDLVGGMMYFLCLLWVWIYIMMWGRVNFIESRMMIINVVEIIIIVIVDILFVELIKLIFWLRGVVCLVFFMFLKVGVVVILGDDKELFVYFIFLFGYKFFVVDGVGVVVGEVVWVEKSGIGFVFG